MMVIAFGCECFHDYLYGQHKIIVETDRKSLEAIMKKPIKQTTPLSAQYDSQQIRQPFPELTCVMKLQINQKRFKLIFWDLDMYLRPCSTN